MSGPQVAAVVVLGVIAWGGLAIAFAVAVGLTIREADRRERHRRESASSAGVRIVLVPATDEFEAELAGAKRPVPPAGGGRRDTHLDGYL